MAKNTRVIAMFAAEKRGLRKNRTSSIGCEQRSSHCTNATRMARPPMIVPSTNGSDQPLDGPSMIPQSTGTRPMTDSAAPTGSSRDADSSRDVGSRSRPATMATITTGTLIRNTEPHQKCSSRNPPINGPNAAPAPAIAAHAPMARARSLGSVKMLVSNDRVAGMISAAPMPMNARVKINMVALSASADAADPTPNTTSPMLNAPRRPNRSPRLPAVRSSPAKISVYPSTIHWS